MPQAKGAVGALLGVGLIGVVLLGVTMSPAGVEVEYQVTSARRAVRLCAHAGPVPVAGKRAFTWLLPPIFAQAPGVALS